MRKYKSAYYKPYIRKIKKSDKGNDFRTAIRLSAAEEMGFKYVLVQRGCNNILEVGRNKHELKRNILVVCSNKDFDKWANYIKKRCQESK